MYDFYTLKLKLVNVLVSKVSDLRSGARFEIMNDASSSLNCCNGFKGENMDSLNS